MSKTRFPTIAICKHVADLIEIIAEHLEAAGYPTSKLHIEDIQKGRINFIAWLENHDPKVIVYDIAPPYEAGLNFLSLIQSSGAMKNRCLILTTTNLPALQEVREGVEAHELLGKPYEVGRLLQVIKEKCPTHTEEAA